jgi:hypothetical protein
MVEKLKGVDEDIIFAGLEEKLQEHGLTSDQFVDALAKEIKSNGPLHFLAGPEDKYNNDGRKF